MILRLSSVDEYTVQDKKVYNVLAPYEMNRDRPDITDTLVFINGELFKVIGVERNLPLTPIKKGEIIGLMVEKA